MIKSSVFVLAVTQHSTNRSPARSDYSIVYVCVYMCSDQCPAAHNVDFLSFRVALSFVISTGGGGGGGGGAQ